MYKKNILLIIISLIVTIHSCKKESTVLPSEIKINDSDFSIDSVVINYMGDGEALCYFLPKNQTIDSSNLAIYISSASFDKLNEGSYRYKSNHYFERTFYIPGFADSIIEASLNISSNDNGYVFDFKIATDSLTISGHVNTRFKINDLAGKMYISSIRFEESSGAQVKKLSNDSLQLSILGSKVSFPQIALYFPCKNCTELPTGIFNIAQGEDSISGKIYLNSSRTLPFSKGQIEIQKDSLAYLKDSATIYELTYKFTFNDTLVNGYYHNTIIFRE